ncbi:MAG: helix-turn-helix domain-containing protein [Micrococcales bacterium]|nr:helix-turn-helix domain-containing protein [Micrococcales bacterium]
MTGPRTDEWTIYVRRLGVELNRRRTALRLSQEKVANAAGVTRGYYHQLERGESRVGRVANPTLLNLVALSQVLGTTVDDLLPDRVPDMRTGR